MDLKYYQAELQLSELRECSIQLRQVDTRSVEYVELYDSIAAHGLWQPLLVRPCPVGGFEVVDGFHRFNCCMKLRLQTIPCYVRGMTDVEVLTVQIQANAVRLETDPINYARHLWRIINIDCELTVAQVAKAVKKSAAWVQSMLQIQSLCNKAKQAVQRGEVSITIAYSLARLKTAVQESLLPQAIALTSKEFEPIVKAHVRKYKQAIKKGSMEAYTNTLFEPMPYLHNMRELRHELAHTRAGSILIAKLNLQTALEGWKNCMEWIFHLDLDAVATQEKNNAARQELADEQARIRKQDRENLRGKN